MNKFAGSLWMKISCTHLQQTPSLETWQHHETQSQEICQKEVVDLVSEPGQCEEGEAGGDEVDHGFLAAGFPNVPEGLLHVLDSGDDVAANLVVLLLFRQVPVVAKHL